jgi:hypothetical protein
MLLQRREAPPVFVAVRPVACGHGQSPDVRAMVGAYEGGSVATFWHAVNGTSVTLDLLPTEARVADFDDQRVVVEKSREGTLTLPVTTHRLTVICPKVAPERLEQKIKIHYAHPLRKV